MLHVHFGAGRLGLGLVAPFLQKPGSELVFLNREQSSKNATGGTGLTAERKTKLLREQPQRRYGIQTPGEPPGVRELVSYTSFETYNSENLEQVISKVIAQSSAKAQGVVVTASVLKIENYSPVVQALNQICSAKANGEDTGEVFLVACENTVSAHEVFESDRFRHLLMPGTYKFSRPVHALVDRMCVGLEEYPGDGKSILNPTVLVRAEEYGSFKLEMTPGAEALQNLCEGAKVEFSRHLDIEKKIKGWLLNGTHWLIALTAFQASEGNRDLKLNEYLAEHPEAQQFAAQVIREISEGIDIMLRKEPEYEGFVRDVSPREYLDGASAAILRRFSRNEDTIRRILARFRQPSADELTTIESFVRRFHDRVDPAITAYAAEKGADPPAVSHGLISLFRLLASGSFVDREAAA